MRIFWSKFFYINIHSVWAKISNKIPCTFSLEKTQLMCSSKNKNLPFLTVTFTSETLLKQILKMFCMAMQLFQIKVGKKMLSSLRPSETWPVSLIIIWFFTYGKSLYTIWQIVYWPQVEQLFFLYAMRHCKISQILFLTECLRWEPLTDDKYFLVLAFRSFF